MARENRAQDVGESKGGTKHRKAPPLVWIVLAVLAAWLIMVVTVGPPNWLP